MEIEHGAKDVLEYWQSMDVKEPLWSRTIGPYHRSRVELYFSNGISCRKMRKT